MEPDAGSAVSGAAILILPSALKAAQTLMVQNLAKQFAPHGVTVNNLAPGVINTDRSRARLTDPAYVNKVLSWIPAGHIGEPEDCAGAALLLCSEGGRYITGQNLFVDGGMGL
jgi:NAD(P)-dependent dehydrogenase (short-subunit alcohol dehydrogenase family)